MGDRITTRGLAEGLVSGGELAEERLAAGGLVDGLAATMLADGLAAGVFSVLTDGLAAAWLDF